MNVKQAAKLMNVGVASVYKARQVEELRPDLAERIDRGELSVHAAWKEATGHRDPTRYERAVRAFNALTEDEKARFLLALNRATGF